MKLAYLTPKLINSASYGGELRLLQTQVILSRITSLKPDAFSFTLSNYSPATERNVRTIGDTIQDLIASLLHCWPRFMVRRSSDARIREVLSWIDSKKPTHVVLEHPLFTDFVPLLKSKDIAVTINCMNVESELVRQLIRPPYINLDLSQRLLKWIAYTRLEQLTFPQADEVWLPSEVDVRRQRSVCRKQIQARCVPNAVDMSNYPLKKVTPDCSIILTATFGYPPNVEAARILRDKILPQVNDTLPDVRLLLVGSDPYGYARTFERSPDVVATGSVPDTKPFLRRAGVCVVPILKGGGTRYKILEALALGRPVVSTPLGAEGLDVVDGEHLLICHIDEFANGIVWLLQNPSEAAVLGKNGRQLVQQKYSWDSVEDIVRQSLFGNISNG